MITADEREMWWEFSRSGRPRGPKPEFTEHLQLKITKEQLFALRRRSLGSKLPVSVLVREAIDLWLKSEQKK